MRNTRELVLSTAAAAALITVVVAGAASAQDAPPTWQPPPPIVAVFGAPRRIVPVAPVPVKPPDLRLRQSDVALRGMFSISFPPDDTLDSALTSRGYSATDAALGVDLALTYRAVWWLFVGGRIGSRWRTLAPTGDGVASETVQVAGTDLLAVAELRIPFGTFELSPDVGVGVAYAEVGQWEGSVARAAPRLSVGASVSLWLSDPIRIVARLAWDLYPVIDVNRFGYDIALGGVLLQFGLEWRPR